MSKRKKIANIIIGIIIILIAYFSYEIVKTLNDNKKIDKEIAKIKEEVIIKEEEEKKEEEPEETEEPTEVKLPLDFNKLKSINSDTVAWIKVDNTNIDYPVVKASNNTYYLSHSFYKTSNINGWIFESSENSSNFDDANTVIFGHNTNGYTMLSELKDIYNGILGTNINITVYLENSIINYKVFSIYLEKPENTGNISKYLNQKIIDYMKDKSKLKIDVDVNEGDQILTLSTCNNVTEDRLILHAKKIS